MKTRNDFGKLAEIFNVTGVGAEIGVQYGIFSETIGKHYTGGILCVDLWQQEDIFTECKQRLATDKFTLWQMPSLEAANLVLDESLDFIYIDANHFKQHVLDDIAAWYPKVRKGGIIAGHDYCLYQDIEVIQAVTEWCEKTGYSINVTTDDFWEGHPFPTWWTVKK